MISFRSWYVSILTTSRKGQLDLILSYCCYYYLLLLQNHCYFLSSLFVCCLTGQYNSAKKRLLQLAVISGWHYQNKSYPVVVIDCDSSVISSFFKIVLKFSFEKLFKVIKKKFIKISLIYLLFDLFCDNNNYSHPPSPYWNPKI